MRKKIFIILSRIPYPLEKGDKLRAYHQIRELSMHHDLVVCALSDESPHPQAREVLRKFTNEIHFFRLSKKGIALRLFLALFSGRPFQVAYFHSKRIHRAMQDLIARHRPDHIFCQLIRTAAYARGTQTDKTIDFQDVLSEGLKRRLAVAPWYMRPLLASEYKRVLAYEREAFEWFDKHCIISTPDRDKIPHKKRKTIAVIPNGVDTAFFRPSNKEKTFDVVFTGNMAYPPNVDGACFLVRDIMPCVWKHMPETRVLIAGATPVQEVRSLASDKVEVTGWVDDIRTCYAASRVFIAPMRIGTGLQNKVLEAMAMKLPCITSPLANNALGAKPGTEILTGSKTEEYAQHILSLLQEKTMRERLTLSGHQFVIHTFNWESTTKRLETLIINQSGRDGTAV